MMSSVLEASRSTSLSPTQIMQVSHGLQRGVGLGANLVVVLVVVLPALGVAEDHVAGAGIRQHGGGDVAGVGTGGGGVAVLPADGEGAPLGAGRHGRQQRGGRAEQHVDPGCGMVGDQGIDLGKLGPGAVHLPVSRRQFASHAVPPLVFRRQMA